MAAAAPRALVADVAARLVLEVERGRLERGEALADRGGEVHPGSAPRVVRARLVFLDVAREVDGLEHREREQQAGPSEDLDLDPRREREGERHVEVRDAHEEKERAPAAARA